MKVLSLCSGYGGLELALDALFPGRVSTIAVCDNYAPDPTNPGTESVNATYPTPTVVDMGWGRTESEWGSWRAEQRTKHRNGNGHGQSLFQALGRPEPEDACRAMESLMGLPRGWVTDLVLSISAQRRLLGNGVVPAQGALGIYRAITNPTND